MSLIKVQNTFRSSKHIGWSYSERRFVTQADIDSGINDPSIVFFAGFASAPSLQTVVVSDIDQTVPVLEEEHIYVQYSESGDGYVGIVESGWSAARNAADGNETEPGQGNSDIAMATQDVGGGDFLIGRSHFEFDLSEIDLTGRTITSIALDLCGFGDNDSTVQVQESTFSGTIALGDFDAFTGAMFLDTPFTWELWDGGDPARNVMTLNATGEAFISGKLGTSSAKLCAREAAHDVADVTPTGIHRNGTWYREIAYDGYPLLKTPRLIITYDKTAVWAPHFDNTQWSLDTGSWDGVKYTTSGDTLILNTPTFATGYKPSKMRITFTGATSIWVQLYNTQGSKKIIDGQMFSGVEMVIDHYNNWDLDELQIFNYDFGDFDVTNIEFLNP